MYIGNVINTTHFNSDSPSTSSTVELAQHQGSVVSNTILPLSDGILSDHNTTINEQNITLHTSSIAFVPNNVAPSPQSDIIYTSSVSNMNHVASAAGTSPFYMQNATPVHFWGSFSRLPKLNLPVFSWDPLKWLSFWDSFDMGVHKKPGLPGYILKKIFTKKHGGRVSSVSQYIVKFFSMEVCRQRKQEVQQ